MKTFWYISIIFSLILFLYGFFPIKTAQKNKLIRPPSTVLHVSVNARELYKPIVDRIVLIVIDALRMDFVNNKSMPFVYTSLNNKSNTIFKMKAESPTVTMPRVKAMTTGSVPQFIDVVFNFASTKINEDSFLHRANAMKKNIVFYGDDTWLKLYPNMFLREEGTTSFFVSDYTEVDNNVTRHLPEELNKQDWDILILHYLGLDHIGHLYNPFSPLIHNKLLEMDHIIETIHNSLQNQSRSIVIVTGDHGMKDSGGHGGSTYAETIVPLIFLGLSAKSTNRQIKQTDLAPTISTLLGIPLPADSIGTTIPEILTNYDVNTSLYIQYYNSINLMSKYSDIQVDFDNCFTDHTNYLNGKRLNASSILDNYNEKLLLVSEKLIKITTTQNMPLLYISCSIMICCLMKLIVLFNTKQMMYIVSLMWISLCSEIIIRTEFKFTLCLSVLLTVLSMICLFGRFYKTVKNILMNDSVETVCLLFGTIFKTFLLVSTSFIEEEHQIWYFYWNTLAVFQARRSFSYSKKDFLFWIVTCVGLRAVRKLNQVGDKWAHLPDISDWLNEPEHYSFLVLFFIIGVCGTMYCCNDNTDDYIIKMLLYPTFFLIIIHGIVHSIYAARLVRIFTIIIAGILYYRETYSNVNSIILTWILWCTPLLRLHNLILLPICYYTAKYLQTIEKPSTINKTMIYMWLSMVLIHSQGICNSIASIDVAPGYFGVSHYFPSVIAVQIVSHICTFPVLTYLLLYDSFRNVDYDSMEYQIKRRNMLNTLIISQVFNMTYFCVIMLLQRNHLFIWTVFAPKLLIESVHTFLLLFVMIACNFNIVKRFRYVFMINRGKNNKIILHRT